MSENVGNIGSLVSKIGRDKGIDPEKLMEALRSAMLSAAKKHYGHSLNLEVQYSEENGDFEVLEFKTVVDKVIDPNTQIGLEQARAELDPDAMVGDELGRKLDTTKLGRIAAQTAKQVIVQKVRDAERDIVFEEYKGMKGQIVNGIVQRYDRGDLIVNLGRTEAAIPKSEQIPKERYRQGDRLRGMILDIDRSARGPQVIMTRSHPDFLQKLFELEVPEIGERVIEIRKVAREPGERAKIAVVSNDSSIDPVGACVGVKGSRVQAVVQELRGERIDIITWADDEPSFVARALAPAEVTRVVVDPEQRSMEVIVADEQLALAIGRKGQNVKLASKLSGWRIDVRSVTVAEEEARRARAALQTIPGIDIAQVELLYRQGFRTVKDIAESSVEELKPILGVEQDSDVEVVRAAAAQLVASAPEEENSEGGSEAPLITDLDQLTLGSALRQSILNAKIHSIFDLASTDKDQQAELFGEDNMQLIQDALDTFFRNRPKI